MITKYRVSRYSNEVEAVEFKRETKDFLFYDRSWGSSKTEEARTAKSSHFDKYYDTKQEALEDLIKRETANLEYHQREAEKAQQVLSKVRAQREEG